MLNHRVDSIANLEAAIGPTPPAMHYKVIDHIDAGAADWIARSPFMLAGIGQGADLRIALVGGRGGVVAERHALLLSGEAAAAVAIAQVGDPFGSLFLLPGIGETLRVNGRVTQVAGGSVRIDVRECYGHCAKALIRSEFWRAEPVEAPARLDEFLAESRFLALATVGRSGDADVSPKGDPAGLLVQRDGEALLFAERPGNRRADSYRNILECGHVALALLVPGARTVALASGMATMTTDPVMLDRFRVDEKAPLMATRVTLDRIVITRSVALADAALWPVRAKSDVDPAKLFVEHIRANKASGVAASLARASLAVPGASHLLRKGLEKDYEENLY
ncbi:hypothetical protein SAMN05428950_103409 [Sphingomonas sp. OV641]|nr:hypothetical protein SAMN05428950_103409 [Sphingomonas sp. OV641]